MRRTLHLGIATALLVGSAVLFANPGFKTKPIDLGTLQTGDRIDVHLLDGVNTEGKAVTFKMWGNPPFLTLTEDGVITGTVAGGYNGTYQFSVALMEAGQLDDTTYVKMALIGSPECTLGKKDYAVPHGDDQDYWYYACPKK